MDQLRIHAEIGLQAKQTIEQQDRLLSEVQKDYKEKCQEYEKLHILNQEYVKKQLQI